MNVYQSKTQQTQQYSYNYQYSAQQQPQNQYPKEIYNRSQQPFAIPNTNTQASPYAKYLNQMPGNSINYSKNLYEEFSNTNNSQQITTLKQATQQKSQTALHTGNMMTYQQPSQRLRDNDMEIQPPYQQSKTMQPRQPQNKKLEISVSNYSQKDFQNAQRDLKSLKQKLEQKRLESAKGPRSQNSVVSQKTMSTDTHSQYRRQGSDIVGDKLTQDQKYNNKTQVNQDRNAGDKRNDNYRKAFNPNDYNYQDQQQDNNEEDYRPSTTQSKTSRQHFKDQTNSPARSQIKEDKPKAPPAYLTQDTSALEECPTCNRKFNEKAYEKHVKICQDVFVKKRKAFDMKEKRIVCDDQVELVKKSEKQEKLQNQKKQNPKAKAQDQPISGTGAKMPKWKMMSLQFRQAIGSSNPSDEYSSAINSAAAQTYEDPSIKQCPGCQRKFNETAAARHIPICTNKAKENAIKNKGKPANQGASSGSGLNGTARVSSNTMKGFGSTNNLNSNTISGSGASGRFGNKKGYN
ncbi:UNKNOWN [Stylonychia lemnae]|uniref:C2HC/C3H-type domain-containing protein n=1 Tax=Stylonychia lemnae TaxID=5949 RepID=A0A078AHQ8_STYLE|nr:UNKNOWN [Stylonychia lemnae]|eukprot:CDW81789.1 UNKNOWN [Stylonychia lemnae]